MCRLAAFPPYFPRQEAINILLNFEKNNTDGTGYVYLDHKKFVVRKTIDKLSDCIKDNNFLKHMPYGGWTLVHLRAASHGENAMRNTHPFIIENKWAFIHNGIWSEYEIPRKIFQKLGEIKGETDTEAAGHLFNLLGPKAFTHVVDRGGVFMGLKRNGKLWISKTSGCLVSYKRNGYILYASELDRDIYKTQRGVDEGWYNLDSGGGLIAKKIIKTAFPLSMYQFKSTKNKSVCHTGLPKTPIAISQNNVPVIDSHRERSYIHGGSMEDPYYMYAGVD